VLLAIDMELELMVDVGNEIRSFNRGRTPAHAATIEIQTFHQRRFPQSNNSALDNQKFMPYCEYLNVTDRSTSECNTVEAKFNFTTLDSPTISNLQAGSRVLKTIKTKMENIDIDKGNEGLLSVYFLGGSIDGIGISGQNNNRPQQSKDFLRSKSIPEAERNSIKLVGITLASVAVILIVVSAFVISHKKQQYDTSTKELILDNDSLMEETYDVGFHPYGASSDNGTDQTSITLNNLKQPPAHTAGEDSSVLTNSSIVYEYLNDGLHSSRKNDFGTQVHSSLDVHKCTSTTCTACSEESNTKFVSVLTNNELESMREISPHGLASYQKDICAKESESLHEEKWRELESTHKKVKVTSRSCLVPNTITL